MPHCFHAASAQHVSSEQGAARRLLVLLYVPRKL